MFGISNVITLILFYQNIIQDRTVCLSLVFSLLILIALSYIEVKYGQKVANIQKSNVSACCKIFWQSQKTCCLQLIICLVDNRLYIFMVQNLLSIILFYHKLLTDNFVCGLLLVSLIVLLGSSYLKNYLSEIQEQILRREL